MDDTLEQRVDTLERAITDGDHDLSGLADAAEMGDRVEKTEERLDELEARIDELDAATQALRGYVGNIRSVNRDVEQRADAALAKAESLESTMSADQQSTATQSSPQQSTGGRGQQAPTNGERTPETRVAAQSSATPDGGVTAEDSHRETTSDERRPRDNHCHVCGRGGGDSRASTDTADEKPLDTTDTGRTNGSGSVTESRIDEWDEAGQRDQPAADQEAGTLQRIRDML